MAIVNNTRMVDSEMVCTCMLEGTQRTMGVDLCPTAVQVRILSKLRRRTNLGLLTSYPSLIDARTTAGHHISRSCDTAPKHNCEANMRDERVQCARKLTQLLGSETYLTVSLLGPL